MKRCDCDFDFDFDFDFHIDIDVGSCRVVLCSVALMSSDDQVIDGIGMKMKMIDHQRPEAMKLCDIGDKVVGEC